MFFHLIYGFRFFGRAFDLGNLDLGAKYELIYTVLKDAPSTSISYILTIRIQYLHTYLPNYIPTYLPIQSSTARGILSNPYQLFFFFFYSSVFFWLVGFSNSDTKKDCKKIMAQPAPKVLLKHNESRNVTFTMRMKRIGNVCMF